ncbi:hypothetical protein [Methylobacterium sp. Leaf112]|uniref:hypothetical protein n=1 Tax=Methylobacterium sp. Leaf112 TaxID=1736258 RepID=UPI0006FDDA5C|nr:hypothetical protein [Methylobacterium sp. Leaf112]KQP65194.1 hypothetical protein ASF52_19885 [Methylobacterium sp. Leaf112]
MVDETVLRGSPPLPGRTPTRGLLASLAMAGLAAAFAWHAPDANTWAAAALVAALALDGLSRMAGARVARRTGPSPRMVGMPSVVLAVGPGAGLGAVLFGFGLIVWPAGFPVLASALAGLVTMGALARLALARIVLAQIVLATPEEPEA